MGAIASFSTWTNTTSTKNGHISYYTKKNNTGKSGKGGKGEKEHTAGSYTYRFHRRVDGAEKSEKTKIK